ncbi:mannitol dehydrogenase family protein [uncultured Jannaschia sp.]|uniref:mannitol dehydrogenase family protein n=1 Tax=uncultured Jannaschia sp. TaxID=293347 RepID=UPI002637C16D|nr:mannitol dehydrogenase family protein [uncultured Jannaschia sp.]
MPDNLTPSGNPRPETGIVHLGLGAFARAFMMPWLAEAGGDWGVIGVSLRSPGVRDALVPQGCVYHAVEMAPDGPAPRLIEHVRNVLVAPEDPEAVLAAMAEPAVRIVSITVTEKGYCHDPATGKLNPGHPDIAHDIVNALPRSAPGYLVRALERRRAAGTPPFTVLSCDNLPHNGALTRSVLIDLARRIDPALAAWIEAEVACPATMVDRIVPATTEDDIAEVARLTGTRDAAPVMHEPFRQWVIEDDFRAGRPALDRVGVQMVNDVAPFEAMKLRMLNGSHSSIAYLGYLAGHEHVSGAVADPAIAGFVRRFWSQVIPTLETPEGVDLAAYADALMERFANPAIRHRTWQIAMDGSQKLPQRLLGTLRDALDAGGETDALLLPVAAWIRYVSGTDENGAPIDVRDPLADRLREAANADDPVGEVLAIRNVFDAELAARLADPLREIHAELRRDGARAGAAARAG